MATRRSPKSNRWAVAVVAALSNFVSFGILFSFGLFFTPVAATFDTTTGPVAPLFSGSVCFYYLAGVVGGRLSDRFGVRPLALFAMVSLPVGLLLTSRADELWHLYVVYIPFVGLAVGSCYSPLIGAVGRLFDEGRAIALGIVLTGVGAGTLAMPLFIRALLDRYDWRSSLVVLAGVAFVVLAITALVADVGPQTGERPPLRIGALLESGRFRWLYLAVVLIGPGFYAPLAFFNDYAVAKGSSAGAAAALLGLVGLASVSTRVIFGAMAERIGPLRQYRISYATMLLGLALWLVSGGNYVILVISACLHGFGWAAWVTATPLLLARWFGVEDLGLLVGGFYTGLGFGALIGPAISGFIIDRSGYEPAIVVVIAITLVAVAALYAPALNKSGGAEGVGLRTVDDGLAGGQPAS